MAWDEKAGEEKIVAEQSGWFGVGKAHKAEVEAVIVMMLLIKMGT